MNRRHMQAMIQWHLDPARFPDGEWMRDMIVMLGDHENRQDGRSVGGSWTVLVRVMERSEGTWDTFGDVAFITDEAPWHLLTPGFTFELWAGRDIATVTVM
ncbi:hypothetical protein [Paenibacillus massiliensis]|uniref:hypothetical protein n=1 Tax=Paenibacillus massiliensis TaxID=225917 RepID=UPI00046EB85A|nr:hypothetical protein [Paenibacillus massiliensis]